MTREPRVLIVESNDALRAMLFAILRHQPVAVDTAATADEALERVSTCDYSLAVVDMDMPDNSGERFVERFRAMRPEATTFVLAVRASSNESYLDPRRVSAVLNKPLEIDTLAEIVRETAHVVAPPEKPLPCPPAESDVRRDGSSTSYLTN